VTRVLTTFKLRLYELKKAGSREVRMNLYRRYFASSRYNRLLIQQMLIKTANNPALTKDVVAMEKQHNQDYSKVIEHVKKWGYFEEFLIAVKEEDDALTRVIEAYDKRMRAGGAS
jgi:hypothetical protein